ncbi:hypothetical protein FRC03_002128 [Tulasnella sp. 419]|nr:hypothetical protein FRC03_002128 [Tulasnella sp. 419]
MADSDNSSDDIANICLAKYASWSKSFKTQPRPNGILQYTILSGIVLSKLSKQDIKAENSNPLIENQRTLKCVSLATGSKCLPVSKMSPKGNILHDCHAEVLARRGYVRWIYEEIARIDSAGYLFVTGSEWIEECTHEKTDESEISRRFKLKDGVKIHMYVSTLPCGDASTLCIALAQLEENPDMAKLKSEHQLPSAGDNRIVRGRNNYSAYGALRTKPGRSDAEPTLSMSCSDKILLWTMTGLQGAHLSMIMDPTYLDEIVVGDVQLSDRDTMRIECQRAFNERMRTSLSEIAPPFQHRAPIVSFTSQNFVHSKSQVSSRPDRSDIVSAAECVIWIADSRETLEALTGGIRRGADLRTASLSPRARSKLCKASLFELHRDTLESLGLGPLSSGTYFESKQLAKEYQNIKHILRGSAGPLNGWVISGKQWEDFDPRS